MITLPNFRIFNQLSNYPPPSDGGKSEDAAYACVPTSLAMCIAYWDNKLVSPDDILDAVYGEGYTGGTDELKFAPVMKSRYGLALTMEPHASGTTQITDAIRSYLKRGIPCIVTMQSDWNAVWGHARFGGWHVGVAYSIDESDNGVLHIANPWKGFDHVRPVREWAARLGIGVWPVAKIGSPSPSPAPSPFLPQGWHDDGATLTTANGVPVVHGFRDYVLAALRAGTWRGGDAYVAEYGDGAGGSVQEFASALLLWNPARGVYEGSMADALRIAAHEHEGKAA